MGLTISLVLRCGHAYSRNLRVRNKIVPTCVVIIITFLIKGTQFYCLLHITDL